ncbi:DUF3598 family protein [Cyanobium gracile]|uniref:DUF3598 domain-containing protein n=1 Tax=Cyanobium gracile (strain ATCC 27147 / PCC 6307) TaxID=292564 RepID=K9P7R5_CYAGP|nr:DUF3598 family protein [Cyanobium gracile]AFY28609.1 protein of unknown function (DUF3598) [Cyanobium gracile PCC 6307]
MPSSAPPRQRLLEVNGGCWEGLFHRLGPDGREIERFPTRLRVSDEDGTIEAALTYLNSGRTVPMRFREPPAAMQISDAGHWSLGMDRMGPWPWIAELCVVHGERRRRVVLRHGVERLESFTYAREWRPGTGDGGPATLLVAEIETIASGEASGSRWRLDDDVEVVIAPAPGQPGPVRVTLAWHPAGACPCRIERRYTPYGLLEPLPPD